MRGARALRFLLVIAVAGAGAGLLYAVLTNQPSRFVGTIYGACIGLSISSFERGLILRRLQQRVRRWPTPLYVPAMEAIAVLLALFGFGVAGTIVWCLHLVEESYFDATIPSFTALAYALLIAAGLVSITRMRDLLGHDVFMSLILARYHKPVEERRIFLFLDVAGSTAFAHRHGDLHAQEYLGAIFAAIAEPVRHYKGAIDDYIGDMALITWPEERGLGDARCVACVFACMAAIEDRRTEWLKRFGQIPDFHAALHGGAVVTAEIGLDRHKITYFGDVVNTTARIEALCRELGARVLISADLLSRLSGLPDQVRAVARGKHSVKGRDQHVVVSSLERTGVATGSAPRPPVAAATGIAALDHAAFDAPSAP